MPRDDSAVVVVDHMAGLRDAVAWLDDHPAFAALLTHTTISAHLDDPALFDAAVRQLGGDAERRCTQTQAQSRRLCGPTQLRATLPLHLMPMAWSGAMRPVMSPVWPK